MSYIGRGVDAISNVEKLDNITFDGSATYALTKSSAAFTPVGANNILISIDGVIQQGNFSVSTTNIVFDWSPTSSNTCNFILHYGTGVLNVPADGSISAAKMAANSVDSDAYVDASIDNAHLADDAVGVAELSATGTASSSTFLRGDNAWAAAGGGKVLQVVTTNSSTAVECTSSTYADLISADITPTNTANKIIAWFNTAGKHQEEGSVSTKDFVRLLRDTTEVKEIADQRWGHENSAEMPIFQNLCVLDAPSSTSSINYSIQVKRNDNTYSTFYGYESGTNCISLILMEIDGT